MALTPTLVVGREDMAIYACTWADGDTTGTLVNGTLAGFNFRNTSGVLVAPTAVIVQTDTVVALTGQTGAVAAGADVVCTKLAGGGSGAASAFHLLLLGPKSKAVG